MINENLKRKLMSCMLNSREHYTEMITPVLVYAQRRLLERISYFGGPSVPQPHFTYTETVTGEKVKQML